MGDDEVTADGALADADRQGYEARIAELERRRQSVEALSRFQIEAYRTRLAELKQSEARHLAEKHRLEARLARLEREFRRVVGDPESIEKGDGE